MMHTRRVHQHIERHSGRFHFIFDQLCHPIANGAHPLQFFLPIRRTELRRRTGGRRTKISRKITQRKICFVPHGRDDRNRAGCNCTHNLFIIKSPKVFRRPAAAADNNQIGARIFSNLPDGFGNLCRSLFPLHQHAI